MSYILDALRKSEQERQIASGRGAGMLYPVMAENNRKSGLKPLLLASSVLAGVAVSTTLIWWVWPKPLASDIAGNNRVSTAKSTANPVPPASPAIISPPVFAERIAVPEPPSSRPRKSLSSEPSVPIQAKQLAEPVAKKSNVQANAGVQAVSQSSGNTNQSEASAEPKGMPKVTISGFINDEQGENLAIINDKLVHEGEEVAPGLRLEKIVNENVIFSYKGQRYRR